MRRLASSLLVLAGALTGLALVSPPAHAALSVTIYASASTVPEGSSVTFTGRAIDARLGSVVRLQRQRTDGSWAVVASRKLVDTRRYRFTTTPPRGYQKYRVVKPAQLGQPGRVSATKTIKVTWRPTVTLGTVKHQVADYATGAVTTTTSGKTARLSAGFELRRELQRSDGTWALHGRVRIAADQTWRDRFSSRHGQRFRYVAPAYGSRLAKASSSFVIDGHWTPTITASAMLDPLTRVATLAGDTTGVQAGSTIRLQYLSDSGVWGAGSTAIQVGSDGTFSTTFTPIMEYPYRVYVPPSGLRRAAVSSTFKVAQGGRARVELNTTTHVDFPPEVFQRTLVVRVDKGQTFTVHDHEWLTATVSDPSGNTLTGTDTSDEAVTMVAPSAGDYVIVLSREPSRSGPTFDITLSTPRVVPTTIDGPATDLVSELPGQVVDLQFDGTAGALISENTPHSTPDSALTLLSPSGRVVPIWHPTYGGTVWHLPDTGQYTVRVAPEFTNRVSREGVQVLSVITETMNLNESATSIDLDQRGRFAVATVDVPSGVDLRISHNVESYLEEWLYDPDGEDILGGHRPKDVRTTDAGTYTLVVSAPDAIDLDLYASTPLAVDAASGTTTTFDRGPNPQREVTFALPVTAGQLLSYEVLDDAGEFCTTRIYPYIDPASSELLDFRIAGVNYPGVFRAVTDGEVKVHVTPCSATGRIRLTPVSIVTPTFVSSVDDGYGNTTVTHRATVVANQPGQVMLVDYSPGTVSGYLRMTATSSTFAVGTSFGAGWGDPSGRSDELLDDPVPWDQISTFVHWGSPWQGYYVVYGGPKAAGSVDLNLTYTHQ